jgi:RHS repeat-associated protein
MWDGLDAYGRKVQGAQPISIRLGYKYVGRRCNGLGDCPYFPGMYDILWSRWDGKIGRWDFSGRGLGGWSLSVQHFYNPAEKTLYLGTGERSEATGVGKVVTEPLSSHNLETKYGIKYGAGFEQLAVAPDGSLYIVSAGNHVYRYDPVNDTVTIVAGWCSDNYCQGGYGGDGGPATLARLHYPQGLAFGPDGSYYIADTLNGRIRRVGADGIITTVAGNGASGYSGDGGPALNASLYNPDNLAVGFDGTIYIADGGNSRIRRVSPDGIITTLVVFPGISYATGLAVGPDGSLYYSSAWSPPNRVFRLWPDGRTTVVAGNATQGSGGDGGPAVEAQLDRPWGVAAERDGTLFITEDFNVTYTVPYGSGNCSQGRVRRVGSDGIITTVAGGGPSCALSPGDYGGFDGPANAATLPGLHSIALGLDGSMYVNHSSYLYRIGPQLSGFSTSDILIPSSDARQVYVFNSSGRHLRTIDALTQSLIYQFSYDSAGRLIQIADTEGNTTTIERNAAGIPTAIVSSYGQRTTFALNAGGYLSGITNPSGETTSFAYSGDGLMTGMTTPRGQTYLYSYDTLGRLTRDENPAGGFQALTRTELENGYEVSHATAMSRTTTYRVENLSTGDKRNVNLFPNGLQAEALYKTDGTDQTTFPDGTRTVGKPGPDPRFGMQAPIAQSFSVSVPSGLSITASAARTVTLSDPNNPLSLQTQNDTVTVNGQSYTSSYNGTTRRYTTRSPVGREFYTTLNEKGDVVEVQTLGYSSVRYLYDPSGRMTNIVKSTGTDERVTGFSYGTDGFLNQVVDPLNRTYGFIRDAAGRVQTYIPPDGSSVTYTYDQNGDVLTVMPPGRPAHSYTYTQDGLIGTYTAPVVGSENSTTQYAYNADQQLSSIIHPDGKMIAFAYDGSGRLSSMTLEEGTITPTYSPSTGALTTLTSPGGVTLDFTYDGFLPTGEMWSGPVTGSVTRTYGAGLRMNSISVNGSQTISLQYDQDGLLTQAGSLAISRSTQNDSITGTNLGAVSTSKTHNSFGELIGESGSYNSSTILDIQYVRDKLGRILQKTETLQGSTDTYAYTYDVNGRLTEVRKNGATISIYTYDGNGNRTGANFGSPVADISYDDQDRLIQYGSTIYTHTANGELQTKTAAGQITTYQYDALGNLRQVTLPAGTVISYLIDGRNRRIGKRVDGSLTQGFLYESALKPIAELDGTNTLRSLFIYGTRSTIPDYMVRDGNTYRILADHLGSPRLVVNTSTGEIVQRIDYDEFGNMTQDTQPGFQPFGFAGGLYDSHTGLLRFGARDYDPRIGRWTTKDYEGFSQGSLNRYTYVDNDPVNWHDPDGQLRVDASSFPTTAQGKKLLEKVRAALRNLTGEKGEGDEWKSVPKKLRGERDWLDENYKEIWDKTVIRYDKNECGAGVGPGEKEGEWVITIGPLFEKERWKVIDLEKVILHEYLHPALKPGLRMGESFEHGTIDQIIKYDLRYPGAPNPAVGLI